MCRQFDSSQHHRKSLSDLRGFFCGAMHPLIPQSLRDSPQGQGERIPPRGLHRSPFRRPSASLIRYAVVSQVHFISFTCDGNRSSVHSGVTGRPIFADLQQRMAGKAGQ